MAKAKLHIYYIRNLYVGIHAQLFVFFDYVIVNIFFFFFFRKNLQECRKAGRRGNYLSSLHA